MEEKRSAERCLGRVSRGKYCSRVGSGRGFWGGEVIKSWNMGWNSGKNKTKIYNLSTKLISFIIQKTIRLRQGIKITQLNKNYIFVSGRFLTRWMIVFYASLSGVTRF
jgi:hypothetical protein